MPTADAFALLGLPRAAAQDEDGVRAAFQKAAAAVHPDAPTDDGDRARRTASFTALNDAAATLSSLPRRLRHLLELEHGDLAAQKSGAPMDAAMMDLFSLTAAAVQGAAAVQAEKRKAATVLAKAMLAPREMVAREKLEDATAKVEEARATLESGLTNIDAARVAGDAGAGRMVMEAAARAAFLEKWQAQLRAAFAGFFAE